MISIVVTFYDNRRMLSLCLSRLLPTIRSYETEVIVVDDNPERPLARAALAPRWVRLVRATTNLGYAGAANLGAEASRGRSLLFIDCDIVPTAGWLDALVEAGRERTDGAVSATIRDLSTGGVFAYGAAFHCTDTVHPYRGNDAAFPLVATDREFRVIPSGAMLIPRSAFRRAGGFDPTFRNAFCDFDLAMRLATSGTPGRVSASSVVYHRGAVTGPARFANYADAKALFFRRWGSAIVDDGLGFLEAACQYLRRERSFASGPYLAANLSSSLYWRDYVDAASAALGVRLVQRYSLPALERNLGHVRIEDRLDWSTCRLRVPILYFVDRYRAVTANDFWFRHRPVLGDVVVDRNGNAALVRDLLCLTSGGARSPRDGRSLAGRRAERA